MNILNYHLKWLILVGEFHLSYKKDTISYIMQAYIILYAHQFSHKNKMLLIPKIALIIPSYVCALTSRLPCPPLVSTFWFRHHKLSLFPGTDFRGLKPELMSLQHFHMDTTHAWVFQPQRTRHCHILSITILVHLERRLLTLWELLSN